MKNVIDKNGKKRDIIKEKEISFFNFLIQKSQLLDLAILLACCLLAYIVMRCCYPYPSTYSDSGGYVDAAIKDEFYVFRPFGYSFFLQVLHSITTNIHSIFIVQLFLLFLASYFFALTIKYFFAPAKKWLWYISLSFLIFTPTSFIMANWIMSDLLFSVQIYIILLLFIFIIKRKSWIAAILYILVLFTSLHVRYSAILFPFVLIPFFIMKKGKMRWVIVILSVLTFQFFYFQTKRTMKETMGINQFSTGFDGWNYANNVFYMLPHIDLKTKDFKTPRLRRLHEFIMLDIDTIKKLATNYTEINAGFMWRNDMALKKYHSKIMQEQQEQQITYLIAFVKLGSGIYKDYGIYIMTHYPFSFLRYYYFPNFEQTFYPNPGCIIDPNPQKPAVVYKYYNIDENNMMQAKYDFLKSNYYHSTMKILYLIMWIAVAGIGIISIVKRKKLAFSGDEKIIFWGLFSFAVIYYASSIFAAPMEIRYCISMHAIQFAYCYILLNKWLTVNG